MRQQQQQQQKGVGDADDAPRERSTPSAPSISRIQQSSVMLSKSSFKARTDEEFIKINQSIMHYSQRGWKVSQSVSQVRSEEVGSLTFLVMDLPMDKSTFATRPGISCNQ